MTDRIGTLTAYDLLAGVIVRFDEAIYMNSAIDSPMITGVNADGLSICTMETGLDQISWSWQDESILTPRSKVSATVATTDTYITVTVGDKAKFSTGDVLRVIKSTAVEYMRVTGYGTTADTLTVSRGFDGTTATNFAANDRVRGVGQILPEGSAAENARSSDRSPHSNNTQIFGPTKVQITRTDTRVRRYGVSDEFSHQAYNRQLEMNIHREQVALYGRQFNSTDDRMRTTGGYFDYCTVNMDTTSTQLTVLSVAAGQQLGYNRGKVPRILGANPVALTDLNDVENTSRVRTESVDSKRGRARVTVVTTEHGDVVVARNRWLETSDAMLWNRENAKRMVLDPLQGKVLPDASDGKSMHFVCEEGWQWEGMNHCMAFTALGYTAADY